MKVNFLSVCGLMLAIFSGNSAFAEDSWIRVNSTSSVKCDLVTPVGTMLEVGVLVDGSVVASAGHTFRSQTLAHLERCENSVRAANLNHEPIYINTSSAEVGLGSSQFGRNNPAPIGVGEIVINDLGSVSCKLEAEPTGSYSTKFIVELDGVKKVVVHHTFSYQYFYQLSRCRAALAQAHFDNSGVYLNINDGELRPLLGYFHNEQ